jgi:hypothetical protein
MNFIQTCIYREGYGWNYMKYMNMGLTWREYLPSLKSGKILHLDQELIGMNIHDGYDLYNKSNKWHENFNQKIKLKIVHN